MQKTLDGVLLSVKMQNTAVVEVTSRKPHRLYKKIMTKAKKYKANTGNLSVKVGDKVSMVQTRPISKETHFKIIKVISL